MYLFDATTNTQVQEYLPDAVSLKNYVLKHYAAPTSPEREQEVRQLGQGLGAWLRSFHDWADLPEQMADLRAMLAGNGAMQRLKLAINYRGLVSMADAHPGILGGVQDELQAICDMATAELENEEALRVIHGDFWTGK